MDQWDRFAAGAGRDIRALGGGDSIDVYEPTETYSEADAYDTTYPDEPTRTIDAEVVPPEAVADRRLEGTISEADLVVYVAESYDQWTGYGVEGEASVRIVVRQTGVEYTVTDVADMTDGLLELQAVER
jgi:hypothetical protein